MLLQPPIVVTSSNNGINCFSLCDSGTFFSLSIVLKYLSTEAGTYTGYWNLKDYLDILHTLKDTNYFYFTSDKSNIVELCEWMERNYSAANPFHGAIKKEIESRMNYNSKYTDIMLYKRKEARHE